MSLGMLLFKQAMPRLHLFVGESDLAKHRDPIFYGYFCFHEDTFFRFLLVVLSRP